NDAHIYLEELIAKGVQNFVVTNIPENLKRKATRGEAELSGANFLKVRNTTEALQQFAVFYRNLYSFPVIGITGSNGKTIVKEWLNFLLSPDYNIIRSPKSYNSQVGVPLSVIAINEKHNLGLFEAGISTTGEMEKLANIIKPNIGILTHLGPAHDEGFTDMPQKIKEKLKLFKGADVVILQKNAIAEQELEGTTTFTWSYNGDADVNITKATHANSTELKIDYNDNSFKVAIPFFDDASAENAISCLMLMLHL